MSDQTLPIDTRLDDFRIAAVLGQGGFGVTYKAVDERLQRDVAIKEYLPSQFAFRDETATVRPRGPNDQEVFAWGLKRFIDEARALALFKHPNIVAVIRYLEANGTAYLVMEYEEGKDLERWLAGRSEPVPEQLLIERIVRPLLDGLAKIHQKGLLHRDIKPENVFIRRDGSPVLIDFGSSRAHGQGQSNTLTSIISAGYSPFEQYGGAQRQGPWSDLYALGGTLYRVVVGGPPTDAIARHQGVVQPSALTAGAGRYSEQLLRAIDQALALDPAERPQSATEFAALLPGAPPAAPSEQSVTVVRRPDAAPGQRRWSSIMIGGALFAIAIVAAGIAWYFEQGTPNPPPAATVENIQIPTDANAPRRPRVPGNHQARRAVTGDDPATGTSAPTGDSNPVVPAVPAPPPAVDERAILTGWSTPDDIENYRNNQIAGALLAYTSNKEKFDDCLAANCADQGALMAKLQEALRGYEWSRGGYRGTIRLDNPRRLVSETCPFMIDVSETIHSETAQRSQQRSYCTRNGFDRQVDHAGPVTDGAIVGAAG